MDIASAVKSLRITNILLCFLRKIIIPSVVVVNAAGCHLAMMSATPAIHSWKWATILGGLSE
jgi:hypothetical protein